jgi:MFS transporter, FSR family, fosmidomycin resistance protein
MARACNVWQERRAHFVECHLVMERKRLNKNNTRSLRGNILGVWDNKRIMAGTGLAHFAHDGFADMLYVFFPVWQTQFSLTFAQVGLFKMLFSGALASFQVPCSFLAQRLGARGLLLWGTLLTSAAVFTCGWSSTPLVLGCLLAIGGLGESVQHPLSSTLISNAYLDKELRRTALGIFNMSGDIGKLLFPGAAALIISRFGWPEASHAVGLFGVAATLTLFFLIVPTKPLTYNAEVETGDTQSKTSLWPWNGAFATLLTMGILDSATRMGFLTYFPFLLRDKGADIALTGLALSLIFAGGIAGKFICGLLATRVGVLQTVLITESLTAACIWSTIVLPLGLVLVLCPILGLALNGTSSVLYGSVPELVPDEKRNQSFAIFYTGTIGSGAISPFLYGFVSDSVGLVPTLIILGTLVLATLPLMLPLRGKLAQ